MITTYIGLGSNLNDPVQQLNTAIKHLQQLKHCKFITCSPFYCSTALLAVDNQQAQPDYLNAVVVLETTLSAEDLLLCLQAIEQQQGRQRNGLRWSARTLDLDILLYGETTIDMPHLQVPHPELTQRNFVIYPLYDVAPDLCLPDGAALQYLRQHCETQGIQAY
ncbi:2-amino-4-hydroxy-6-hydroxymethyldihydropteridine diphosphokinase [Candidatus Venteria ishoeyi]|uniref:2-amino-4-hydroxy-6-hydroxymethyldihydropteridine pyrophosphokinase n=1 Tax=Candidatus Venteria ishoeyi TaxID=1899563 RepID=A0A1H6FC01_9GAMM|nr:2-amino-4-hydroxy-6-hydroxymethyldihydropteridine diphosphokinase [Candidatus Venteria ishoeyi]SEH06921.1 2-amino-4-hydroxy-6-hydroxymethyldihydropteridin e pyrophosphokinase [Candidatus Venteria ishoeyi]